MDVEQSVQGFRALGQFIQIPLLQRLERIKEAPDIPLFEGIMPRLPPFIQDGRDEPVRAHSNATGTNEKIMRSRALD